jgi:CDP-glucose 4,6-dehydratase
MVAAPASAPHAVNFGPDPGSFCTVADVVDAFSARFGGRPGWEPDGAAHPAEAAALTLSSTLAERALEWRPVLNIEESLSWTADWYQSYAAGADMRAVTAAQLTAYRQRSGRIAVSGR